MSERPVEVLIVEDNPHDLELALRALRRHHLANRVQVARDGVEALDLIFGDAGFADGNASGRPRVILLDLKLPRVDGLEVLRQVKADLRTRSIPVVVLTSSREESDIVESYDLGVNSYIVKPVEFETFVEAVRQLGFYWVLMNKAPGGDQGGGVVS
ncbi:MAG: response regulator [Chloroflexota bacterium]|nr:MAG: response regulator [Chloroflexota bacterium]